MVTIYGSELTLNYSMMMERYPNLKEEVGGSIPNCEVISLLDKRLPRRSTTSCALVMACWPFDLLELSFNSNEFGRVLLVKPSMFGKVEVHLLEVSWRFEPNHSISGN